MPKKNVEAIYNALRQKLQANTISQEERKQLAFIENEILPDQQLLHALRYDINYLTTLILDVLTYGEDIKILIFADGQVGEIRNLEVTNHNAIKVNPAEPHISLSIRFYLEEFIENKELSEIIIPQILDEDEKYILREVRNKNIDILTIKMKDGNVNSISKEFRGELSEKQVVEVKKILGLKNYEGIVLDSRDDKRIAFKRSIKDVKKFR